MPPIRPSKHVRDPLQKAERQPWEVVKALEDAYDNSQEHVRKLKDAYAEVQEKLKLSQEQNESLKNQLKAFEEEYSDMVTGGATCETEHREFNPIQIDLEKEQLALKYYDRANIKYVHSKGLISWGAASKIVEAYYDIDHPWHNWLTHRLIQLHHAEEYE